MRWLSSWTAELVLAVEVLLFVNSSSAVLTMNVAGRTLKLLSEGLKRVATSGTKILASGCVVEDEAAIRLNVQPIVVGLDCADRRIARQTSRIETAVTTSTRRGTLGLCNLGGRDLARFKA